MTCRETERILLERSLGHPPTGADRSAFLAHLRACPSCARAAREEEVLTTDLAGLRTEVPFEVDVVLRVAARVAVLPPRRTFLAARRWLLASAAAFALVLGGTAVAYEGLLRQDARALMLVTVPVLGALGRLALQLWEAVLPLLQQGARLAPSFRTALVAALIVMTVTTVLGLRRELRRAPDAKGVS